MGARCLFLAGSGNSPSADAGSARAERDVRKKAREYSRARDQMLEATDTEHAPWYIVRSDDKRRARLHLIAHFLSLIPYGEVPREKVELPKRSKKEAYDDLASIANRRFVAEKH